MGQEYINDTWTGGRARNMDTRTDQELRELYKDLEIVADITKKILGWVCHVVRMDQGKTVKKAFETKQERSRRRGRSRWRWLEHVEKDLREIKVK
jgi:hypothetical protein